MGEIKYFLLQDNITVISTYDDIPDSFPLTEDEYLAILDGNSPPYYFDGNNWQERPSWSHDTLSVYEDETITFTLPNDYEKLYINGELSENKFNCEKPGEFLIEVEPFPYKKIKILVNVLPKPEKEKDRKIESLDKDCNKYILSHYPISRQNTFKAKFSHIIYELANNIEAYSQEQIDNMQAAKSRILSVLSWIETVLDYYYQKLDEIKQAETIEEIRSVVWDFSQFDESDPLVTIEEIRNYLLGTLWS